MIGQADQKPGKDAWDRYKDLIGELSAINLEFVKIAH